MNTKMNDKFVAHTNAQAESNLSTLLANSRQDNVLVSSEVIPMEKLTGMSSRRGLENAIVCENQIVNVVSNSYGHLPNEKFFLGVEEKLIDADIYYQQRSINRDNRSFVVDYILADDRYKIEVKGDKDILRPMLRFVNSYDGVGLAIPGICFTFFGFFTLIAGYLAIPHGQRFSGEDIVVIFAVFVFDGYV